MVLSSTESSRSRGQVEVLGGLDLATQEGNPFLLPRLHVNMKVQVCETEGKAWEEAANFQTFGFHKALSKEQIPTLSE